MLEENIRETIRTLAESGKARKAIARFLKIDIKTVRKVIAETGLGKKERRDKINIPEEKVKALYQKCDGYVQRMYEILTEDEGVSIGYSTLTRLVRECFPKQSSQRCKSFPDIPGEEMQHDTSDYHVKLAGRKQKVICSGLYFRYSKMRYVKFYPRFDRFLMKCFMHEALVYFGYCAQVCIIDNTHLAVLHGTGENAVFSPEMLTFANRYGFKWKAHRIKQSNRKAGKERNFLTMETNFFPGRSFESMADLNDQGRSWAIERFANRPLSKTSLIPSQLFEYEKPYLIKLNDNLPSPCRSHMRSVDKYGYIAFNGNYYWIPEGISGKVKVLEYETRIDVYQKGKNLIGYPLPAWDVKNIRIVPDDHKQRTKQPSNRKKGCDAEEQKLRGLGDTVCSYLDFILAQECTIRQKPRLIRELFRLSKKMTAELFTRCLQRALQYKITSLKSIERIAGTLLEDDIGEPSQTEIPAADEYENRSAYQQGRISREEDLEQYGKLTEGDRHE